MADDATPRPASAALLVLALGLLLGFGVGFVALLSHLPVDPVLGDFRTGESGDDSSDDYEFYTVLADQIAVRPDATRFEAIRPDAARPDAARPDVIWSDAARPGAARGEAALALRTERAGLLVPPATRAVPGNAQRLEAVGKRERAVPASGPGRQSYYLQAGNFRAPDEAERARAAVLMLGLDAFIVTRRGSDGTTGHRVRIGPFFDKDILTEAKKRLRAGHVPYEIVRVTG